MIEVLGEELQLDQVLFISTLILTIFVWVSARYLEDNIEKTLPKDTFSKDTLFEEVLFAGLFSMNLVYVLIPGFVFVFTNSIPQWSSTNVFKIVTLLGLIAVTYESYIRFRQNIT